MSLTKRNWDPMWPAFLSRAAEALGVESVNINDGMYFRTAEDSASVRAKADESMQQSAPMPR